MSRINTNVPSIVAARILEKNNTTLNQSLTRLSTGLRINSGKDDPAGLIASENLRSELTAIEAAMDNANRADQIIAVTEGSLQEINSLLIELEDLVDHAANTAGLSDEEVAANQLQIDSILDSINRIANSSEFNGKKLLNGELDYSTSGVTTGATASAVTHLKINSARIPEGGSRSVTIKMTQSALTAQLIYSGSATGSGVTTLQIGGKYGTELLSFASGTSVSAVIAAVNQSKELTGVSASLSGAGSTAAVKFNSVDYGSDAFVSVEAISGTFTVTGGTSSTKDYGQDAGVEINGSTAVTKGLDVSLRTSALSVDMTLSSAFATQLTATKTFTITGGGADFSIAPTVGINGLASIGIQSVNTGSLGKGDIGYLSSLASGAANDLSSKNFATAQRIIRESSKSISSLRGRLGSFQKNTLAPTINSLQVALENTTAAQSAIRDADFAQETSNLTRAQILVQAGTASLQLANRAPQNVLALLG